MRLRAGGCSLAWYDWPLFGVVWLLWLTIVAIIKLFTKLYAYFTRRYPEMKRGDGNG